MTASGTSSSSCIVQAGPAGVLTLGCLLGCVTIPWAYGLVCERSVTQRPEIVSTDTMCHPAGVLGACLAVTKSCGGRLHDFHYCLGGSSKRNSRLGVAIVLAASCLQFIATCMFWLAASWH